MIHRFLTTIGIGKTLIPFVISISFLFPFQIVSAQATVDKKITRLTVFSDIGRIPHTNDAGSRKIPLNTYTRIEIRRPIDLEQRNDLQYARRTFIGRIFAGKKYTANVILKSEVGNFKATTPLLTREYESSSATGESFVREASREDFSFPLFLVSSDTKSSVAKFAFTVDVAQTSESNGAALSLDLITKALDTVAPGSSVLTKLTENGVQAKAAAVEDTVNQLFSDKVRESTNFDLLLETGDQYYLEYRGPEKELTVYENKRLFGKWIIGFADPRPSIFSNIVCSDDNCSNRLNVFHAATQYPNTVLAFKLIDKVEEFGTVAAYLKQQDWWTQSLTAVNTAKKSDGDSPFVALCRQIRGAISGLGLNDLDGKIVASSVAGSGFVSDIASKKLSELDDCKQG